MDIDFNTHALVSTRRDMLNPNDATKSRIEKCVINLFMFNYIFCGSVFVKNGGSFE